MTELLERALREILELAEDREDIRDTESGPVPNDWMRVAQTCRDALNGVKRP